MLLKPTRLPRGFPCLVTATVYHPKQNVETDASLREHLFDSLTLAEARYPNCAFVVCGDFNRFNTQQLTNHFRLKQIVKVPTRKDVTLDLIMTNLYEYYSEPKAFPPFGLSDHATVLVSPKNREKSVNPTKYVSKRDMRASRKAELGRYLSTMDWDLLLSSCETCDELERTLREVIHTGLDIIMPVKKVRINLKDAPWMTLELKTLILKRQKAFHRHGADSSIFKFYRNSVNRSRKRCKATFYNSKVGHLKTDDPKRWWSEVRRLSGSCAPSGDLRNHLNVEELNDLPPKDVANAINSALLEPLEEYRLASALLPLPLEESPEFLEVSEDRVYRTLNSLNPAKACGPDRIPNWLLKEYAELLAVPVTRILNFSYKEQRLPCVWKLADVSPLPKKKPVKEIKKDLRPISLTPNMSKIAEGYVVDDFIKPAALQVLDDRQYGAVPKSSTTLALLEMLDSWTKATDGNGSTIRTVLFDYRKAFDLIDHGILVNKLKSLNLPVSIINWVIDFLSDRQQRIKLVEECFSEWDSVPSGVPQGTKLGPWLFVIIINDLNIRNASLWKYVDDTTVSETIPKGAISYAQLVVDEVVEWSRLNRFQLNTDKCKELRISFARHKPDLPPLMACGNALEVVDSAKLLGVTISSNLTWNLHVAEVIKKTSKRLYFLLQLKRAHVPKNDLVTFYTTCVRSVCDYAVQVFFSSLPLYLINDLERVQKERYQLSIHT